MAMSLRRRDVTTGLAALAAGYGGAARAQTAAYRGTNLRFITVRSVHQDAMARRLTEIAGQWGINLEIRQTTADDLGKKVVLDFVAGAESWDLIYPGGVQAMYEWHGRGIVADLAPLIAANSDPKLLAWEDFTKEARDAATFGQKVLALPAATSDQAVAWRRDLFGHADEVTAFRAKYGYDLGAPADYGQWRDIAEFFTRKKGQSLAGKPLERDFYGTVFSDKAGIFVWHIYQNVALAFGVTLYDPATGKADLLSPARDRGGEVPGVHGALHAAGAYRHGQSGGHGDLHLRRLRLHHRVFRPRAGHAEAPGLGGAAGSGGVRSAAHGGRQSERRAQRGPVRAGDGVRVRHVQEQGGGLQAAGGRGGVRLATDDGAAISGLHAQPGVGADKPSPSRNPRCDTSSTTQPIRRWRR